MKDTVLRLFIGKAMMPRVYALLVTIMVLDYFSGRDISTDVFYLLPIALVAREASGFKVYVFCFVAMVAWFVADILSGQKHDSEWIFIWNAVVRFCVFIIVAQLIISASEKSQFYRYLANVDELTGILNRRGFLERAEEELTRAKRFKRSFSLAFLDLDNFKAVNDDLGHQVGDKLLKDFAQCVKDNIRQTDVVGRLGGDEFAILFVETDQDATKRAFEKCHKQLNELIKLNAWPISISAGVVTYTDTGALLSELLEKADQWMYRVKKSGKNSVVYKYDSELVG